MTKRFMSIVADAAESKEKFDSSIMHLKANLQQSLENIDSMRFTCAPRTGWLRGSFSYPWVLVCSIVPAIKELF
ncbi:MAG: hypothetical protein HUK20_09650 [Fibrobacter sp.]|nr:hypothetical protein [Fibrobacter sp.]